MENFSQLFAWVELSINQLSQECFFSKYKLIVIYGWPLIWIITCVWQFDFESDIFSNFAWGGGFQFFNKLDFGFLKNNFRKIFFFSKYLLYFVSKIVLTLCEQKIDLVIEKTFENSRLKAENLHNFWRSLDQFIQTFF